MTLFISYRRTKEHISITRSRGAVGCSGNGSHFRFYQNFIYRVSLPGLQRYVFDICFMKTDRLIACEVKSSDWGCLKKVTIFSKETD